MFLRAFLIVSAFTFSSITLAAGTINHLNVDGETVYFSTTQAKTAIACAAPATAEQYTTTLSTKSGRALYALLVSAMSNNAPVSVTSAGDCADAERVERAQGVSVSPTVSSGATNKVTFAGYVATDGGYFNKNYHRSPLIAATELCSVKYSGSRVMLWDDYIELLGSHEFTENIWMLDAVQATNASSAGASNNNYDFGQQVVVFKDGTSVYFSLRQSGAYERGDFLSASYSRNVNCSDWRSNSSNDRGVYMSASESSKGRLQTQACSQIRNLACVK